jgi:hypothetical protein
MELSLSPRTKRHPRAFCHLDNNEDDDGSAGEVEGAAVGGGCSQQQQTWRGEKQPAGRGGTAAPFRMGKKMATPRLVQLVDAGAFAGL